jgi:HTH-type transcriptional regulator / antitoxin HigA
VEIWGASTGIREREEEANEFAADFLIPPKDFASLVENRPFSGERIISFATRVGIAPGIVVGRLQHENLLPYSHLNSLKVRYRWLERDD